MSPGQSGNPSQSGNPGQSGSDEQLGRPPRPPLQFGLRAVLAIMVAVSLLFGTLRWFEVSPLASAVVLVILIVSVAAAMGLVVAIAGAADDEH